MNEQEQRNLIVQLKDLTNLPFLRCKYALEKANWNLEEAKKILRDQNEPRFLLRD